MEGKVFTSLLGFCAVLTVCVQADSADGGCPAGYFSCSNAACVLQSKMCDAANDCGDNSDEDDPLCVTYLRYNFERGMGDLTQGIDDVEDRTDWTTTIATGQGLMLLPNGDHTTNTSSGHDLYLYSVHSRPGNLTAWLLTPVFAPTVGKNCWVRLFYTLPWASSSLNIKYRTRTSGPADAQIWSASGRVAGWRGVSQQLSIASPFQLIIEGVATEKDGTVGLDDVSFTPGCQKISGSGPSSPFTTPARSTSHRTSTMASNSGSSGCPAGYFSCSNAACVLQSKMCDAANDCGDNSDEGDPVCVTYLRYNFERDMGDLTQGIDGVEDRTDWTTTIATGQELMLLPRGDHTTNTSSGHDLYLYSVHSRPGNLTAWLLTPVFAPTVGKNCWVRLFYTLPWASSSLNIKYRTQTSGPADALIWSASGRVAGWRGVSQQLSIASPFQLIIEGVATEKDGTVGLDDVSFTPGCQNSTGSGASTPVSAPPSSFTSPAGSTSHRTSTVGSNSGSSGAQKPSCMSDQYQCLSGDCINAAQHCDFTLDCLDSSDESDCHTQDVCSFSSNLCSWHENSTTEAVWRRVQPASVRGDGAPAWDGDHLDHGFFLWLSDATVSSAGHGVHPISSPTYSSAGAQCVVKFSYWVQGFNPGSLLLSITGFLVDNYELWRSTGTTSNTWAHMSVSIGRRSHPFSLTFSRLDVTSMSGTIAIDNIQFSNCTLPPPSITCPSIDMFHCANHACVDKSQTCNNVDDCGDQSDEDAIGMCEAYRKFEFEPDFGDFTQGLNGVDDQWDWQLSDSQSPHAEMPLDHTTGSPTGHYAFLWANENTHAGDTAWLISHALAGVQKNGDSVCHVRFYYYIYGSSSHSLGVQIRSLNGSPGSGEVWSTSESLGAVWQKADVVLTSSNPFQFIIEGTLRGSSYGIAIDDISLTPACVYYPPRLPPATSSPPPTPTTTPRPSTTSARTRPTACGSQQFLCLTEFRCIDLRQQCDGLRDCEDGSDETGCATQTPCGRNPFQCSSGGCVSASQRCDFTPDCSDSSDESDCHTQDVCSFSSNLCGWHENSTTEAVWRRVQPASVRGDGAPAWDGDHLDHGFFLWLSDATVSSPGHGVHPISSPTFSSAGAQCVVKFSYWVQGSNPGSLLLSITGFLVDNYELWRSTGTTSNMWAHMSVSIGRRSHPFTLTFSRLDVTSMSGTIAIDNIQFSNCSLPPPSVSCPNVAMYHCSRKACVDHNRICDNVDDCGDQSDEDTTGLCGAYRKYEFEPDLGDFTQGVNGVEDQRDWQVFDPATPHVEMPLDHTTGAPAGHYAYFWANHNTRANDSAWLVSHPIAGVTDNTCNVRFYYYIYGSSHHRIDVRLRSFSSGPGGEALWTMSGSEGAIWRRTDVQLTSPVPFQFIIEGTVAGGNYGIAVDDISLSPGCVYFSGPLPYSPTSSVGTTPGSTGEPSCSSRQFQCKGSLQCIDVASRCDRRADCADGSDETGCGCLGGFFNCSNGACVLQSLTCDAANDCGDDSDESNSMCVDYLRYNFEGGIGDFSQGVSGVEDTGDWVAVTGADQSSLGLPPVDHTTNTSSGRDLYMQAPSSGPGSYTAWLLTRVFARTNWVGKRCRMRFFYSTPRASSSLSIKYRTHRSGPADGHIWNISGHGEGPIWMAMTLDLEVASPFQLVIEGAVREKDGVVALDDVSFSPDCQYSTRDLPPLTTAASRSSLASFSPSSSAIGPSTTTLGVSRSQRASTQANGAQASSGSDDNRSGCPAGYYRCNNAVCVRQSKTCDAANDCGDDSDEDNSLCATYMRYNFEGSIGDFTQGISGVEDTTDWHSKAGGYNQVLQKDHSTNSTSGHYLYTQAPRGAHGHGTAWLLSRPFAPTAGKNCRMRFFYFVEWESSSLSIKYRTHSSGPADGTFWSLGAGTEDGPRWTGRSQQLSLTFPFQLIIEGVLTEKDMIVALDDVSFTPDCVYSSTGLPPLPPRSGSDKGSSSDKWAVPVGVVLSVLVVAAVTAVVFVFFRKGKLFRGGRDMNGFSNANYNDTSETKIRMSDL